MAFWVVCFGGIGLCVGMTMMVEIIAKGVFRMDHPDGTSLEKR